MIAGTIVMLNPALHGVCGSGFELPSVPHRLVFKFVSVPFGRSEIWFVRSDWRGYFCVFVNLSCCIHQIVIQNPYAMRTGLFVYFARFWRTPCNHTVIMKKLLKIQTQPIIQSLMRCLLRDALFWRVAQAWRRRLFWRFSAVIVCSYWRGWGKFSASNFAQILCRTTLHGRWHAGGRGLSSRADFTDGYADCRWRRGLEGWSHGAWRIF